MNTKPPPLNQPPCSFSSMYYHTVWGMSNPKVKNPWPKIQRLMKSVNKRHKERKEQSHD